MTTGRINQVTLFPLTQRKRHGPGTSAEIRVPTLGQQIKSEFFQPRNCAPVTPKGLPWQAQPTETEIRKSRLPRIHSALR